MMVLTLSHIKSARYEKRSPKSHERTSKETKMDDTVDRGDLTPEELATARRYAIVIEWSPEDDAFVVSVPDIPDLHTHGATREEAATMGDEAIAVWLAADQKLGIEAPTPRFSALGTLSKDA